MAIDRDCVVITVLHENPSSDNGKTRGHWGSQLERKSETNLRLSKANDGVTTIFAERSRHCFIPKSQGSCFKWNNELQMHMSNGYEIDRRRETNMEQAKIEAEEVLAKNKLKFGKLVEEIVLRIGVKDRTAKTRIKEWKKLNIIKQDDMGLYQLNQ